jgi:hypothetical protein
MALEGFAPVGPASCVRLRRGRGARRAGTAARLSSSWGLVPPHVPPPGTRGGRADHRPTGRREASRGALEQRVDLLPRAEPKITRGNDPLAVGHGERAQRPRHLLDLLVETLDSPRVDLVSMTLMRTKCIRTRWGRPQANSVLSAEPLACQLGKVLERGGDANRRGAQRDQLAKQAASQLSYGPRAPFYGLQAPLAGRDDGLWKRYGNVSANAATAYRRWRDLLRRLATEMPASCRA